jgi:hypothetical protein
VRPVTFAIAGLVLVTLLGADVAAAASIDRSLTARTQAMRLLPGRFHNISTVACSPDRSSVSAVRGSVRYWQRFWCTGRTYARASFRLRFDTTGKCSACWTITHLSGTRAADLRVKDGASPEPPPAPAPASPGPIGDYTGAASGHWLSDVSADGTSIRLEDGSIWLVSPSSRSGAAKWLSLSKITVRAGTDPSFGYRLVNTDDQETADARFLRFD